MSTTAALSFDPASIQFIDLPWKLPSDSIRLPEGSPLVPAPLRSDAPPPPALQGPSNDRAPSPRGETFATQARYTYSTAIVLNPVESEQPLTQTVTRTGVQAFDLEITRLPASVDEGHSAEPESQIDYADYLLTNRGETPVSINTHGNIEWKEEGFTYLSPGESAVFTGSVRSQDGDNFDGMWVRPVAIVSYSGEPPLPVEVNGTLARNLNFDADWVHILTPMGATERGYTLSPAVQLENMGLEPLTVTLEAGFGYRDVVTRFIKEVVPYAVTIPPGETRLVPIETGRRYSGSWCGTPISYSYDLFELKIRAG